MENGDGGHRKICAEEVLSKLKDDGDFDRLRLKIIRKLKENEEMRNCIITMVQQSAALNCPEAENMKPRQLSDAIHEEVGDKVMSQISDSLWGIIRSPEGMKIEITETVQSVYGKLLNPRGNEEGGSSSVSSLVPVQKQVDNISSVQTASVHETDDISDSDPMEPPGFSLSNHHQNNQVEQQKQLQLPVPQDRRPVEEQGQEPHHSEGAIKPENKDSAPSGFIAGEESKQPCDGSDDDPDLPPGFG